VLYGEGPVGYEPLLETNVRKLERMTKGEVRTLEELVRTLEELERRLYELERRLDELDRREGEARQKTS
jgi:predicted RNase H-like nuclease (RuvC/YqgF family)